MKKVFLVLAHVAAVSLSTACRTTGNSSTAKSDWAGPAAADGSRTYVIDWPCEPKRFDSTAETNVSEEEEYCEWRIEDAATASQKICRFTTSFDNTRDFYLNSRGQTPINSIGAAQALRDDCAATAQRLLAAGQSAGHLCSDIQATNCVPERNSDPEICDKVRFVVGQNTAKKLSFAIDQMPPDGTAFSPQPLMRLGLLAGLPTGCAYSKADKTEATCTIAATDTCFALTGQLRTGIQVLTSPFAPAAATAAGTAAMGLTGGQSVRNPAGQGTNPYVPGEPQAPTPATGN